MSTTQTSKTSTPTSPHPQNSIVSLSGISKVFNNGTIAVEDLTLDVRNGEFLTLIGPSGCGKSTILRIIAGLEKSTIGEIEWYNQTRPAFRGVSKLEMSFVFQEPTLMPWTTAFSNVHLPLKLKGKSKKEAAPEILEALKMVGLEDFADSYPRELSGGMKMRVSIARALVTKPKLLLMDEPFAALDEITRFKLNNDLLNLWQKFGWTVIFVTHSVFESVYLSNRILVVSSRPGKIVDEINIGEPYPRSDSFRMSNSYNDFCRLASKSLYKAIGVGSNA